MNREVHVRICGSPGWATAQGDPAALGQNVAQLLGPPQEMAVTLTLGVLQDGIGGETIDNQPAVEVGTENSLGDFVAATLADGVNGNLLVGEDPEPGIEGTDTPAGLVGLDDVGPAQGIDQQVVGGPGQLGKALLGTDERGRADGESAIGAQEVTDLAIGDAEAVFEFGSHGEDDGAEGIAGSADGIGDLFGMAALATEAADRTVARLHVELGDDGDDRRQVSLVLDDNAGINERAVALGTAGTGDWDDAVDAFGRRRGAIGGWMAAAAAGPLLAFLGMAAAEGRGLPVGLSLGLAELLAKAAIVLFEFGEPALQVGNVTVALLTAGTGREHHGKPHARFRVEGIASRCVVEMHCHPTAGVKSSARRKSRGR